MRQRSLLFFLMLLLLSLMLLPALALAEEAQEITSECAITSSYKSYLYRLTDGRLNTPFELPRRCDPWIQVSAPEGKTAGGFYVVWTSQPEPCNVEVWDAASEQYTRVGECGARGMSHEYIRLPEGTADFRLIAPEGRETIPVCELQVYTPGELPPTVQDWQPTPEKTDLLLLVAHPDDEYIFFGGLLPTYAAQRGLHVTVAYLTHANERRLHELLNGLWLAGVREYPIPLPFIDRFTATLAKGYELWPREEVLDAVQGIIERVKPEVVVTHDLNGEYGHGAHRIAGDICLALIRDQERALQWMPKKLYLHLWPENQIMMDWESPLSAFDGQTGLEVGLQAFHCHESQVGFGYKRPDGTTYRFTVSSHDEFDNALFGLVCSSVGPDEAKDDFMEHIAPEAAP